MSGYTKGRLSDIEQNELWDRTSVAVGNAKELPTDTSESFSYIGIFVEELENVRALKYVLPISTYIYMKGYR